jgi:hypothetical protein
MINPVLQRKSMPRGTIDHDDEDMVETYFVKMIVVVYVRFYCPALASMISILHPE